MRIVSLLPSATEILFALGLGDELVGVTFECDFPAAARGKPIVSNTALPVGLTPGEIDRLVRERLAAGEDLYRLESDALGELRPDLVITQDLCRVCAVDTSSTDEALEALGIDAEVVTLDPSTLAGVLDSIHIVGRATGRETEARALVDSLRERLERVSRRLQGAPRRPTVVLEWTDPPFASGHWVPELVQASGGHEALGRPGARSVPVEWSAISSAAPEVIVVAPCGFRLPEATTLAAGLLGAGRLPPGAEVWAINADAYVVRPGPRLIDGVEQLASILHPGRGGPADPTRVARVRASPQ